METKTGELSEEYGEAYSFFTSEKKVTWKIPNFLDMPKRESYYATSPEFCLGNAIWHFILYPNLCGNFIEIDIIASQSLVPEHRIHHTTGLKTCHGVGYHCRSEKHTFLRYTGQKVLYLHRSHITDQSQLLLPSGTLTVFCQIRIKGESTPKASSRTQQHRNEPPQTELKDASSQTEVPESVTQTGQQRAASQTEVEEASTSVQKLQLDYSKLLKTEEDSDVCLKVSDKEFRAHRCILRARSKVFFAMFKHETEEKASGEVVIDDLDPDSFPDFLQHVYAGRVDGLSDENVFNLYWAADKYDLQELKSECREYMKRTLSADTFCDVMIVALRHEEEELLKMAIDYFSANFAKIFVTVNWQRFLTDHPTEANELLIKSFVPK